MTKEEKKERREVKNKLRDAIRKHLSRDARFHLTNNQLKDLVKRKADQILAGKNPEQVVEYYGFVKLNNGTKPSITA